MPGQFWSRIILPTLVASLLPWSLLSAQDASFSQPALLPDPWDEANPYVQRIAELERRLQTLEQQQQHAPAAPPGEIPGYVPPQADPAWTGEIHSSDWKPVDWSPRVELHGRLHTDVGFFMQDEVNRETLGDIQDGVDFRRLRLAALGNLADMFDFQVDIDVATGRIILFDNYISVHELPVLQRVRVGHFREPFSLESLTSSNYYTFLERASPFALVPFRNWGITTEQTYLDEYATFSTGVFRTDSDSVGADLGDSGEWASTSRVTWLPWYDEPSDGRYYLHLGAAYSFRDADDGVVDFEELPEGVLTALGDGLLPPFLATGPIPCVNFQEVGLESALVLGSLSLQSEWVGCWVNQIDGPPLFFHGAYAYVSYFLTGESRQYQRQLGVFGITPVNSPFFRVRSGDRILWGPGAWEIAFRWSFLDLFDDGLPLQDDGSLNGGFDTHLTFGCNWYLNDNIRIQSNYIQVLLDNPNFGPSNAGLWMTRFSVYW